MQAKNKESNFQSLDALETNPEINAPDNNSARKNTIDGNIIGYIKRLWLRMSKSKFINCSS